MEARQPRTLWRHGDFMKLSIGQTISELGSRITLIGLPIVAIEVLHATSAPPGTKCGSAPNRAS